MRILSLFTVLQSILFVKSFHLHPSNIQIRFSNIERGIFNKAQFNEPEKSSSNYGRKEYWNDSYKKEREFTWYSTWSDVSPFFRELVPISKDTRVLLPGIGNDSSMVDMYDDGFRHLTAFDYAPEGVECAKRFFGTTRVLPSGSMNDAPVRDEGQEGVDLRVLDARDLPYEDSAFDAVLEKGTLDAIYLSGADNKDLSYEQLSLAVSELARVVRKGGIVVSITAACTEAVRSAFTNANVWKVKRDGSFHMTEDGYCSNNVDATMLAWERL